MTYQQAQLLSCKKEFMKALEQTQPTKELRNASDRLFIYIDKIIKGDTNESTDSK